MFKNRNSKLNAALKITALFVITYLTLSAPASAATTLQEILGKAKDVLVSLKDFLIYLGYVMAVLCIIVGAFKLKAKSDGDQQVKVAHVVILFVAAILFGGGAFWVQSTADSVGVEISSGI
ncbi:Uncharacterised protein [Enterobacter hormaechei]|uniref:DUF6750 family protein n=1 Tax=Enterobacter hormaechei TaxID=158836 RepID=UPI0007978F3E|nr:DUF6750 family protein [Enterobacter hormaechei]SAE40298.1 Uncharacterised protein [Enterobacter hormaechei]